MEAPPSLRAGAGAGLVAGLALALAQAALRLAGIPLPSELVADRVLPLLPVDLFNFVIGHLGGPQSAKRSALVGGFLGVAVLGAALGGVFAWLRQHVGMATRRPWLFLSMLAVVSWLALVVALGGVLQASNLGLEPAFAALATGAALLLEFLLFAVLLAVGSPPGARPEEASRRRFLLGAAGLLLAAGGGTLATVLYRRSSLGYDGVTYIGPGVRITPNDQFYVVTKNIIDPQPLASLWRLEVAGRVARPATYDLAGLMGLPGAVDREYTLECISNNVGSGLMSNAIWRGVALRTLLERAGVLADAVGISLRAVDGYTHSISLETAMGDAPLVAYCMNGADLPLRHGYPVRLLVPSAYGEVSVKWLTRIEAVDHSAAGYYESQGWRPLYVETSSRIDEPGEGTVVAAGRSLQVRGIAYAAERGISRVEVSTDGGAGWSPATIVSGARYTWSLWSFPWTPQDRGPQTLAVRAYDGDGTLQKLTHRRSAPAGATGVHSVRLTVA